MKKGNLVKKIVFMMLVVAMTFVMTACGDEEMDVKDLVYTGKILPCMEQIKGDIASYTVVEDTLYIYTTEWIESEVEGIPGIETAIGSEMNQYFYKCKSDGSDFVEIPVELPYNTEEWMSYFRVSEKGNFCFLYNYYDSAADETGYILRIAGQDGALIKEMDITDSFGEEDIICLGMELDKDENIYLLTEKSVFLFDKEGDMLAEMEEGSALTNIAVTNKGEVIVYVSSEDEFYIRTVDAEALEFGKKMEIALNSYNYTSLISGAKYSFYYSDGSGIFGYDMKKGKSRELLNWVSSNVNTNYIGETRALPNGDFITHYYDYSGYTRETASNGQPAGYTENGLYIFTKVDPKEVKEKTEITYSALYVDDAIRAQIIAYNNSQDRYRVVVKDYSTSKDPIRDMNQDLMAGNVPDIIDMAGISSDPYIAGGMLTDLYELMENDPEIKKEDFIDNILTIMETDGKLYRISPTFGLNAVIGKTSDVGEKETFTVKDLTELENSRKVPAKAFHMTSDSTVLTQICEADYYHFIDWQKGEAGFDSREFIDLLEYAGTYLSDEEVDWSEESGSFSSQLKSGQILFATVSNMSVEEIQFYKALFGTDISFIGYPSREKNGGAISMNMELGICSASENKEAAWEFLKTFLTREYVSGNRETQYFGFPLRKDCLEDIIKRYSTKIKYTDDFGNEILPYESKWGYDDMEIDITPLSREEVTMLREAIMSACHMYVYDEEIMSIITEEAEAYFNDESTAEEVAGRIQERVSAYLKEATQEETNEISIR